jgi:hypothetical protein
LLLKICVKITTIIAVIFKGCLDKKRDSIFYLVND